MITGLTEFTEMMQDHAHSLRQDESEVAINRPADRGHGAAHRVRSFFLRTVTAARLTIDSRRQDKTLREEIIA